MEIQATFTTITAIFLLIILGYGAKKSGVLKAGHVGIVNSLVINLTMPAFIFVYTHRKPLTPEMIRVPFLAFGMELIVIALAYLAARIMKLNRPTTGALILVSAFGNTGFLGYPVVKAAFNSDKHAMLTAVLFDEFAMAFILGSLGVAIAKSFSGSKFAWTNMLQFLKSPLFPAAVISLILRNTYIPPMIMNTLRVISLGTMPLAMLSIGLSLRPSKLRLYPMPITVAFLLKMAVLPVLLYFTLPLIGVKGVVHNVAILEGAMPAAVFTGVVSGKYGANNEFAAGAIFLMTMASMLVIPGILMFL